MRRFTQAIKNARFIQSAAPHLFATDPTSEGFGTGIPLEILSGLHRMAPNSPLLGRYPHVTGFLKDHTLPIPKTMGPGDMPIRYTLFTGTIYIVQITFQTPSRSYMVATPDLQMIVEYASHAIVPISQYATQYGDLDVNSVTVSPIIITFAVQLLQNTCTDNDVQSWVNEIVASNNLSPDSCLLIAIPFGITEFGPIGPVPNNGGYHWNANVPYIVVGVDRSGLTLDDIVDGYAMGVSHEIAEMVVNPTPYAHLQNPEVCDPCDSNCNNFGWRCYFDQSDRYLGSNGDTPPRGFNYSYFICGVVNPAGAGYCPASFENCSYAPPGYPKIPIWIGPIVLQILTGIIEDGGGIGIVGGHPVPLPPWGAVEVDILIAVAIHNLAGSIRNRASGELQIVAMELVANVAKQEIERLELH